MALYRLRVKFFVHRTSAHEAETLLVLCAFS